MHYLVNITILTGAFADTIIAKMVAKGETVSPALVTGDKFLTVETRDTLGDTVAFVVEKEGDDKALSIRDVVASVLREQKISFFSLVVMKAGGNAWQGGNIPRTVAKIAPSSWDRLNSTEDIQ